MDAYFSGKRELFKGLAIDKLEQKWTQYPILHLDLNTAKYDTKESLDEVLNDAIVGMGIRLRRRCRRDIPVTAFLGIS
jgi:hypothetical protein